MSIVAETAARHNLEAEKAAIGACMVNPAAVDRAAAILRPGDFWRGHHEKIWKAIRDVHAAGGAVDYLTVRDALGEVGGPAYVASLTDGVPTSTNVEHYARIVRRCALERRIAAAQAAGHWAVVARYANELQAPANTDAEDEIPWSPVSEVTADDAWAAHASGVAFPGRMILFAGHRKAGKSTLVAAVAAAVAGGADWLSGEMIDAGSVIWFGGAGESTPADVRLMTVDAGASPGALARIQFARIMRSDRMAAALAEHAPDDLRLVVIDSGRSLVTADGGKENDADSIRLSLGRIAAWQAEHGQDVAVLIVHHFKKDLDVPVGHRFRGSGDWGAVVDVIIEFDRTDDGAKLTYEGRRGAPVDPLHVAWNHHGYTATSATADNPPSSASGRIAKMDAAIQTYLEEHPEGVSGRKVRTAIAGRAKVVAERLATVGVRRADGLWIGGSATAKPTPPEPREPPVPEVVPGVVPPLFPRHGTTGTGVVPVVVPVVPAPIGEPPTGNHPPVVPEVVPGTVAGTTTAETEATRMTDLEFENLRTIYDIQDAMDGHPLGLAAVIDAWRVGMTDDGPETTRDVQRAGRLPDDFIAAWRESAAGGRDVWIDAARDRIATWKREMAA